MRASWFPFNGVTFGIISMKLLLIVLGDVQSVEPEYQNSVGRDDTSKKLMAVDLVLVSAEGGTGEGKSAVAGEEGFNSACRKAVCSEIG